MKPFFFSILTAFIFALLIDIFGFNFQALIFDKSHFIEQNLPLDKVTLDSTGKYEDGVINCTNQCELIFSDINVPAKTLHIETTGEVKYSTLSIYFKDSREQYVFDKVREIHFSPKDANGINTIIYPYGDLKELKLSFSILPKTFSIKKITLNPAPVLQLSWVRILMFSFLFSWIILAKRFPYLIFDKTNLKHIVLILMPLTLCLACATWIYSQLPKSASPLLTYKDPNIFIPIDDTYNKLFFAFQKGQLYLNEAHQTLIDLDNPYSKGERTNKKSSTPWDNAYYKGKIYLYTGIAPILTLYYPTYWLTGKTPSPNLSKFIFCCFAIIALFLAFYEVVKYFCRGINLTTFIPTYLALVFASFVLPTLTMSLKYHLDKTCGVAFSALTLFFAYRAYNRPHGKIRNMLLILAGANYALVVLSRPLDILLVSAFIFPIFIKQIFSSNLKETLKTIYRKKYEILSFSAPVFVGAMIVMTYNYLRFESVFEFGQSYQLTVQDQTYYRGLVSDFFPSLVNFFFYAPNISSVFPYITTNVLWSFYNGQYLNKEAFIGVLFFPINFIIFFAILIIKRKDWRFVYYFVMLSVILIIYYTFTTAGFILRYIIDVNWALALLSTVSICYVAMNQKVATNKIFIRGLLLLSISTVIVGGLLVFSNYDNTFKNVITATYLAFENLL